MSWSLGKRINALKKTLTIKRALRNSSLNSAPRRLTSTTPPPFRLAIIGSGPAGFYSASRILSKMPSAHVDMYEKLPVPFGLVRFGVAPDHPEVKNCEERFEKVAASPRFNFIGNVAVGAALPLRALTPHYDALLFAYGASKDKLLGVDGEHLQGIYSARAFVGWYNGLPEDADLAPQLENGEEAVVIGQGNVAMDVARILLSDVDALRKTDIAEEALERLAKSRVKRVRVVGRRGPMQAAFTIKEVRELMTLPSVAFTPISPDLLPSDPSTLPRQQKRITQLLSRGSPTPFSHASKFWSLDFLLSPLRFLPQNEPQAPLPPSHTPPHLSALTFQKMRFANLSTSLSPAAQVLPTPSTLTTPTSLAFRSIGYKSEPLPGLSSDLGIAFDADRGIIPNDALGRVVAPTPADPHPGPGPGAMAMDVDVEEGQGRRGRHLPGLYCAGWVKRGPTGVIASTMEDAFVSADSIARDWAAGVPFLNGGSAAQEGGGSTGRRGWDGVKEEAEKRGLRRVSWADWKRIDAVERQRGKERGKEREKIKSVAEMLALLDLDR